MLAGTTTAGRAVTGPADSERQRRVTDPVPTGRGSTGGAVALQWAAVLLVMVGQLTVQSTLFRVGMCRGIGRQDYLLALGVVPVVIAFAAWAISVRLGRDTESRSAFTFGWILPVLFMIPVFLIAALFDQPIYFDPEHAQVPTACEADQARAYAINLIQLAPLVGLVLVHFFSGLRLPVGARVAGVAILAVVTWVPFFLVVNPYGWDWLA